jgi:hypothetical protein
MGDPQQEQPGRQAAARRRAARERVQRLEQARSELEQLQEKEAKAERRVSVSEPEARVMKHGDGGYAPSYNAQLSTDAEQKIIVSARLTQNASDSGELVPSLEAIEQQQGVKPRQVVADGGYTTREAIVEMARQEIDFFGSLGDKKAREVATMKTAGIDPAFAPSNFIVLREQEALQCPAGQVLPRVRQSRKDGVVYQQYRAEASDCAGCAFHQQCCPNSAARTVSVLQEKPEVTSFAQKMATEAARQIYRQRGAVAEFPHAWLKEKIGLRKFRLRGRARLVWSCCGPVSRITSCSGSGSRGGPPCKLPSPSRDFLPSRPLTRSQGAMGRAEPAFCTRGSAMRTFALWFSMRTVAAPTICFRHSPPAEKP